LRISPSHTAAMWAYVHKAMLYYLILHLALCCPCQRRACFALTVTRDLSVPYAVFICSLPVLHLARLCCQPCASHGDPGAQCLLCWFFMQPAMLRTLSQYHTGTAASSSGPMFGVTMKTSGAWLMLGGAWDGGSRELHRCPPELHRHAYIRCLLPACSFPATSVGVTMSRVGTYQDSNLGNDCARGACEYLYGHSFQRLLLLRLLSHGFLCTTRLGVFILHSHFRAPS
jgi:hypothetical protein